MRPEKKHKHSAMKTDTAFQLTFQKATKKVCLAVQDFCNGWALEQEF